MLNVRPELFYIKNQIRRRCHDCAQPVRFRSGPLQRSLSKCSWLLSAAAPRAGGKQLMGHEKVLEIKEIKALCSDRQTRASSASPYGTSRAFHVTRTEPMLAPCSWKSQSAPRDRGEEHTLTKSNKQTEQFCRKMR